MYVCIHQHVYYCNRWESDEDGVCMGMAIRTVLRCEVILSHACSTRIVRSYPMMFSRIGTTYIHCSEVLVHYKHRPFESM